MVAKKSEKVNKYRYLRLPLATAEEAKMRREHLIRIGTIRPASEAYGCGHLGPVITAACPVCGNSTVVWQ